MQRWPDPGEPKRTPPQRQDGQPDAASGAPHGETERPRVPLWPADTTTPATPPRRAPVLQRPPAEQDDENPPWERESGRFPIPRRGQRGDAGVGGDGPSASGSWSWGSPMEQSFPAMNTNDMTGTGKMSAVVPLDAGISGWSKGVRAPAVEPRAPADSVPLDDQPSTQMRAMRRGNLTRATAIITVSLLLSRILGLARTSLFAYTFGGEKVSDKIGIDAFTNAFALPDTIFSIVAGGALASAFIPVFADYLIDRRDKQEAWRVASSALNLCMLLLLVLAGISFVYTKPFLELTLHPLFTNGNPEGDLIVQLTRIMLLQPIFLGGATVAVAILQARQSFLLPAIGQVIYTASLIGGILVTLLDRQTHFLGGHVGLLGPTWGVVVGGALQFATQIPGLVHAKMHYSFTFNFRHPGIVRMFRLMVPRILNAVLLFVSIYINRDLLGLLSNQFGATYGYVTAFSLVLLPIGVFGMAVSQAAFPTLAALVAANNWAQLRETILTTLRGVTFLAMPSSLGLIVLAEPISQLLLAHGYFDPHLLPKISQPLIFFSIGLLGLSLVEILTRCFYALHDSRTAVEVSVLQFLFVIGLSVLLLQPMGASGLALATSLGSLGEALVLLLLLSPRIGGLQLRRLWVFTLNVLAASIVAALSALFVYRLSLHFLPIGPQSPKQTVELFVRVVVSILAACAVYLGFSRFLRIDDAIALDRIIKRVMRR